MKTEKMGKRRIRMSQRKRETKREEEREEAEEEGLIRLTCGVRVGPTIIIIIVCETDMWVPRGLLFSQVKLSRKHHVIPRQIETESKLATQAPRQLKPPLKPLRDLICTGFDS